jgi:transposase, IS5 family
VRRNFRQAVFSELFVRQRAGKNSWLDELNRLIDWSKIEELFADVYASPEGRASFPVLLYVKILLLQTWWGLTDEGVEEALDDRLSFRRFAGLPLDEPAPDHTAIWRFRQKLQGARLEALFAEIHDQLDALGLVVRKGTLIDATLLKSKARPPRPKQGEVSAADPQASLIRRKGKATYGYKAHLAVDEVSELVRGVEVTAADIHDSLAFQCLVQGDEARVTADKAYADKKNRQLLAKLGIRDCILKKAHKFRELTGYESFVNTVWSQQRAPVERWPAALKGRCRLGRLRYVGLARNTTAVVLACVALNLRRAARLLAPDSVRHDVRRPV